MSGGSGTNSSWTILTPEETVAETLKPLAEGAEGHDDGGASTAGSVLSSQTAEGLPVEDHLASDKNKEALSEDSGTDHHTYVPSSVMDVPIPSSSEASSDALSQSEAAADGAAEPSTHPDSFSDSYSHLTPSPNEHEPTPLSTETLGAADLPHQEESSHLLNGEELQQERDESDLSPRTPDLGKQADSHEDSEVAKGKTEEEEEGELEGQRKRSLLAALERVGRAEEDEEVEEEFQLPQRDDDSGFSVNKCILGAVILLGLGTIFFSGVFMDLNEEGDYNTRALKDSEVPGKQQEWLNPEVPPPPVDAASSELLNELAKGNQQISELQAQLQAQGEELKVAKGQAAEGAAERPQWEEENSRLKKEVASLPVLQKENERMKRELESVPALQKELETLRSTVTELKLSAASEAARASASPAAPPSGGQAEDSRQGAGASTVGDTGKDEHTVKKVKELKDRHDRGERKQWEEGKKSEWKGEKKERKDGGKAEWKKGTQEQGKFDKVKDKESKEGDKKQGKEKEWTKEKTRGDDGKLWKEREGKKEWKEKNERKDWKEEKDRKTSKHERPGEGKQSKGKEDNERKKGKGHAEGHKDEWKGERKVKDGFKESGKEKWQKKDSNERGERKEWRKEGEWKGKEHGREGKGRGERKEWEDDRKYGKEKGKDAKRQQSDEKEWKRKDERKEWEKEEGWKRKDERKEWEKEEGWKRKDERKEWRNEGDSKRKAERKESGKEEDWKRKEWENEGDYKRKAERKESGKEEDWKKKEKKQKGEWKKEATSFQKNKEEHKPTGDHHHEEHLWGERKPPHSHRKPTPSQPEYWSQQRTRLQNNPKPAHACQSAETCAQSEGLLPVPRPQFETLLQSYLAKAEEAGVDAAKREELAKLAAEFFPDGVFAHDRMSFRDFVEDLSDILEDMVDADEDGDDSALEDEMEEFQSEAVKAFSAPGHGEKDKVRGERKMESGRERG